MWKVYLLLCADGTLYAGVTTNLKKRLAAHQSGKGSRYTRSRGALRIVHSEQAANRSAALKREWALKKLTREQKLKLASSRRLVGKRRLLDTPRVGQ